MRQNRGNLRQMFAPASRSRIGENRALRRFVHSRGAVPVTINSKAGHGPDGTIEMKRTPTFALIGVMLLALGVIAATAIVAWQHIADTGTTETAESAGFTAAVKIGGPFNLVTHRGEKVTDETYRGRFLFVYFGYAYCPDICPTELANMAATLDHMGSAASAVQPLFVTVDPERDSPAFMSEYVAQFHPAMVGLTGTSKQIADVAKRYRVFYRKVEDESASEYLMDHSNFIYLMGPDGEFLSMFRGGTDPAAVAKTITKYVEKHGAGA